VRKCCVVALVVSVLVTVGAAVWNVPRAEDEGNGANIGASLLMIIGFLSTVVSVFWVFASSSAVGARDTASKGNDVKTAWPRTNE